MSLKGLAGPGLKAGAPKNQWAGPWLLGPCRGLVCWRSPPIRIVNCSVCYYAFVAFSALSSWSLWRSSTSVCSQNQAFSGCSSFFSGRRFLFFIIRWWEIRTGASITRNLDSKLPPSPPPAPPLPLSFPFLCLGGSHPLNSAKGLRPEGAL